MLKIFIGFDHRQPVSYNVLQYSILSQSTEPVSITPLVLKQLPISKFGLTPFTYTRFLVPYLCDYQGTALFLDSDMLVLTDISELMKYANDSYAIQVIKHAMEFEQSSLMIFNCAHDANRVLTPEYIERTEHLHQLSWLTSSLIGKLPPEWNHLVGYDTPSNKAKLLHYTQGIPGFEETDVCEHADKWNRIAEELISAASWSDLMGNSIHSLEFKNTKLPKYLFNPKTNEPCPKYEEKVKSLVSDNQIT